MTDWIKSEPPMSSWDEHTLDLDPILVCVTTHCSGELKSATIEIQVNNEDIKLDSVEALKQLAERMGRAVAECLV